MLLFQTSANTCFLFLFFLTLVITTFKFAYVASNVLCIRIHMSVPDLVLPCKETPVGGGICWKKQTFSRLHLTCAFCVDVDMCVWCVWTAGPPSFFPLFLFPSFSLSTINSGFYGNKRFSGTGLKREKRVSIFSSQKTFLWNTVSYGLYWVNSLCSMSIGEKRDDAQTTFPFRVKTLYRVRLSPAQSNVVIYKNDEAEIKTQALKRRKRGYTAMVLF